MTMKITNESFTSRSFLTALCVISVLFFNIALAFAQDEVAEEVDADVAAEQKTEQVADEKKENDKKFTFQKGIIASHGNYAGSEAINTTTADPVSGDTLSPISGSVSRKGDTCTAVVTNISEGEKYSVSYRVIGLDKNGRKVFSRSYSASLGPKGSSERSVPCRKDWSMQVELTSGRKTGG